MKWSGLISFVLILFIMLSAGCISQTDTDNEKTSEQKIPAQNSLSESTKGPTQQVNQESDAANLKSESGSDERYYYNIKIIDPADLETLKNEIGADEYPIHNEKGELIGIVSPRKLYIRGDLVNLQRDSGGSGKTFDKIDVAEHLVDTTFGNDNAKLNLFKTDKDYQFWLDAFYTTDDTRFLLELAPVLNSLSDTTQFEDEELALGFLKTNYEDVPYNFYNIKIIPHEMLEDFKDDRKSDERLIKDPEGKLIGMVGNDHLYLLDELTPEQRQYYMQYGILYSMGMHGMTYSEKDSFFYQVGGAHNTELSDLDKEAIKLLYGGRLKTGADMEEVKKTLGLDT